jgi:hypothetical protein
MHLAIIIVTKHLSSDIKQQEVLMCYDFQHGIIDDEKDIMFITKVTLFAHVLFYY